MAAPDAARAVAGHLGLLAEAQPASAQDVRIGRGWQGGFVRDFATVDRLRRKLPMDLPMSRLWPGVTL